MDDPVSWKATIATLITVSLVYMACIGKYTYEGKPVFTGLFRWLWP